MSEKETTKLKVSPWRILKIFGIAFLVFEAIFYVSFQGVKGTFFPPDASFYYYTPALIAASIIFGAISLTQTYYEINGAVFVHSKMGKVVEYSFNNIIYIDEEFSEKKKMMRFFTKEGKEHLLVFDKNGELYKTALEKCPLISKEEFCRRFHNIKM
jgi:hypothetical protein